MPAAHGPSLILQRDGKEYTAVMEKTARHVTDAQLLSELERFLNITDRCRSALRTAAPALDEKFEILQNLFYEKIRSEPNMAEYLEGSDIQSRHAIVGWGKDLLSGEYDLSYLHKRWMIGVKHFRIGLPVRYPILMMEVVREFLMHAVQETCPPDEVDETLLALSRLLSLDTAIFNHAYEATILRQLNDVVGVSPDLFFTLINAAR
jgi:Protoglobin